MIILLSNYFCVVEIKNTTCSNSTIISVWPIFLFLFCSFLSGESQEYNMWQLSVYLSTSGWHFSIFTYFCVVEIKNIACDSYL